MFSGWELDIDPGSPKKSMSSFGDGRHVFSPDVYVHLKKQLKKHTVQVSRLPFSVEALMSDSKPREPSESHEGTESLKEDEQQSVVETPHQLLPVKSELMERENVSPLTPIPTMMSSPGRK